LPRDHQSNVGYLSVKDQLMKGGTNKKEVTKAAKKKKGKKDLGE